MNTPLSGTGRLADDLYLVAHHEITGKPHLQPRALGLGLAGGLLGELMLPGAIRLKGGLVVIGDGTPPGDALARSVLSQIGGEREDLAARDWLLFLARTAAGDIARRLGQAGYLTRTAGRRFSRTPRWVPAGPDCAFAPLVRVKAALSTRGPAAAQPLLLGGLAAACGLGHQLALYLPPGAERHLEQAARYLDPSLQELIAQTQAAVDSALLTHRL
ncbi:MAG TPA: GPP34 family phosphoprotein [Streptosporangiaceae bacterium]|nr:GPP34 family phosphoprotein [Streptosporangiaceae bacterium]